MQLFLFEAVELGDKRQVNGVLVLLPTLVSHLIEDKGVGRLETGKLPESEGSADMDEREEVVESEVDEYCERSSLSNCAVLGGGVPNDEIKLGDAIKFLSNKLELYSLFPLIFIVLFNLLGKNAD